MSMAIKLFRNVTCLRSPVMASQLLIQSRSMKMTNNAVLLCHGCYFEVDHRTDNKFVLCKVNPAHKQQQRNNTDFRLRQKYYRWGLQDLGADRKYIHARVSDVGYHSKDHVRIMKNNFKFDGLKALSKKATEISSGKSEELD